eukprot:TRINITY_DN60157_c0_g1_i1.p1 TRINITY_DN60157_c0_g1~~TRINITY_DN60157_c0_g1_i1.p1  ORF type:complete len:404 (+),score=172.68 TRINITY_DN60157_c0_g1_i1:97-1308(+)
MSKLRHKERTVMASRLDALHRLGTGKEAEGSHRIVLPMNVHVSHTRGVVAMVLCLIGFSSHAASGFFDDDYRLILVTFTCGTLVQSALVHHIWQLGREVVFHTVNLVNFHTLYLVANFAAIVFLEVLTISQGRNKLVMLPVMLYWVGITTYVVFSDLLRFRKPRWEQITLMLVIINNVRAIVAGTSRYGDVQLNLIINKDAHSTLGSLVLTYNILIMRVFLNRWRDPYALLFKSVTLRYVIAEDDEEYQQAKKAGGLYGIPIEMLDLSGHRSFARRSIIGSGVTQRVVLQSSSNPDDVAIDVNGQQQQSQQQRDRRAASLHASLPSSKTGSVVSLLSAQQQQQQKLQPVRGSGADSSVSDADPADSTDKSPGASPKKSKKKRSLIKKKASTGKKDSVSRLHSL